MNAFQSNTKIESFIKKKDAAGQRYSQADKAVISSYEGSGGLASRGARGQGLLHEFYTPSWLCQKMWQLAKHYGYTTGSILEPACGTGRFFEDAKKPSEITGFEINPMAARIAQILYPKAKVYNQHFETAFLEPPRYTSTMKNSSTWLDGYPFSLVISNPPYGKHINQYSSYFKKEMFKQMETFFIYKSLQVLKPGGLLVFVTSSNIIRSGISYQKEKAKIEELAELVDAYRLPPVFRFSQVPTDIIILKKLNR